MIASSKLLLTLLCLVCTFFLYTNDPFSTSPDDFAVAPSNTSEAIIFDSQPCTPQIPLAPNTSSIPADFVSKTTDPTSDGSLEKRPRILQATMMFGDKYTGLNEKTLQSHIDHAERWGYEDHILRREIVGAGEWDKFIFCKILHVLDLIIRELKRPREDRAQWIIWYDADTLILNPNVHWELFLPPDTFPDINFMATKNLDGFNAGLFFFRVDEWSVEILSDAYALRRLRPEIDIQGNIEQNALKYLFGQEPNKKHVLYQPQRWYNGFKGDERAETEISEGDMLVHFAGINHDYEKEKKNEIMSRWFARMAEQPDEWQVPLEKTKYPKEIEAFWTTFKAAKDMLDTVHVKPDSQSGPDQDVKRASDELKWAIEELAYDAAHVKKCMKDMGQALKAAENQPVGPGSGGHADQHAFKTAKEPTESGVGGQGRFLDTHGQQAT